MEVRINRLTQGEPIVRKLLSEEGATVGEIRGAFLEILNQAESHKLCANCPNEHCSPEVGCCGGCPLHSKKKGCTLRNTTCLGFSCRYLQEWLEGRGLFDRLQGLNLVFWKLEGFRGFWRLHSSLKLRLEPFGSNFRILLKGSDEPLPSRSGPKGPWYKPRGWRGRSPWVR